MQDGQSVGLLAGLRVMELGHYIAAPFATRLLGDLGADVIKVEPLSGDPVRGWGESLPEGNLWWSVHGRNKRSIALDLKRAEARAVILDLVPHCDVVIENFRPGQLARWGLGDEALRAQRRDLVIAHVSGYGQTGPDREKPAFGVIGEAIGGLRHVTNDPGSTRAPIRAGISIGDSLAGVYAAFGVMAALWRRDRPEGASEGATVDVALTEAVLSVMEGMLPEYGALGKLRQPSGSRIPTASPSSAYPSRDGRWIVIAANADALFIQLMQVIGRPDLAMDARFATNALRVSEADSLDEAIAGWTVEHDLEPLERQLTEAGIPCTRIYTAADCAADPQFRARGMVRSAADPGLGREILHPGVVPTINGRPGAIRWTGPAIGAHSDEVLKLSGRTASDIATLRATGVVR